MNTPLHVKDSPIGPNAMHELQDPREIHRLLRHYGSHSLAYATLQPGMRYWGHGEWGFAAFRKYLGQHIFLGDPVCAGDTLDAMLDGLTQTFPRALYMQINRPAAEYLESRGYYITPVGVENDIDTAAFSLDGKRKADLRHYRNRARAGNVRVDEVPDTRAVRAALQPVSDAWLPLKSWLAHELEFLARPFQTTPEPGTRIFTGSIGNRVVAFVILDPIYHQGTVEGYTVSILRHIPGTPEGTVDAIVLAVIETCACEGIGRVSLGVSPFHRLKELGRAEGRGALPVYGLYRALTRWGNPIYHFRGLSFHKSRYRARETPVYTAVAGPIGLFSLFASARACRML